MKKLFAIITSIALLISIIGIIPASAGTISNNDATNATTLTINGAPVNDILATENSRNFYRFTLTEASNVKVLLTSQTDKSYEVCFSFYKSKSIENYSFYDNYSLLVPTKNDTASSCAIDEILHPGEYYIEISYDILSYTNAPLHSDAPNYNISVIANPVDFTSAEPNNSFDTAQKLDENKVAYSAIHSKDSMDIFKITLSEREKVNILTSGEIYDAYEHRYPFDIVVYKATDDLGSYQKIDNAQIYCGTSNKHFITNDTRWTRTESYYLDAGTYCFVFSSHYDLNDSAEFKLMYQTEDSKPLFKNAETQHLILNKLKIKAGETMSLAVTEGTVKKWITNNKKVLRINQAGKITALKQGITDVVAELTDGKKVQKRVSVKYSPHFSNGKKKISTLKINKGETKKVFINNKVKGSKYTVISKGNLKITGKKALNYFNVKGVKKGNNTLKIKTNGMILKLKVTVK